MFPNGSTWPIILNLLFGPNFKVQLPNHHLSAELTFYRYRRGYLILRTYEVWEDSTVFMLDAKTKYIGLDLSTSLFISKQEDYMSSNPWTFVGQKNEDAVYGYFFTDDLKNTMEVTIDDAHFCLYNLNKFICAGPQDQNTTNSTEADGDLHLVRFEHQSGIVAFKHQDELLCVRFNHEGRHIVRPCKSNEVKNKIIFYETKEDNFQTHYFNVHWNETAIRKGLRMKKPQVILAKYKATPRRPKKESLSVIVVLFGLMVLTWMMGLLIIQTQVMMFRMSMKFAKRLRAERKRRRRRFHLTPVRLEKSVTACQSETLDATTQLSASFKTTAHDGTDLLTSAVSVETSNRSGGRAQLRKYADIIAVQKKLLDATQQVSDFNKTHEADVDVDKTAATVSTSINVP